jgi:hypothetical protein
MKPYLQTIAQWDWQPLKIILLGLAGYGITRIYLVTDYVSQEVCIWVSLVYMLVVLPKTRLLTGLIYAGILSLFYWAQW